MLKTIKSWESFEYRSVWKITSRKSGKTFKTKNTGKCILSSQEAKLGENFLATSFSTSLTKNGSFEVDIVDADSFKGGE